MKDLKHLYYFESLLREANNELVQQAQAEGKRAVGYTCQQIPEPLLNLGDCFSVRLRAPRTEPLGVATCCMSNCTCEFARALLECGVEGGFGFLDGLVGVDACSVMSRCYEYFERLKRSEKPRMFVAHVDAPAKAEDHAARQYAGQLRRRLLSRMEESCGADTSDAAMRKAVAEHNEVCRVLREIGALRALDNAPVTGYEYHVLNLISYVCPKRLILPKLRETLGEIKRRETDARPWYRARVAVVGGELDDPALTRMIEEAGAFVVSDRYCFGSAPGREEIVLNDADDVLTQICAHYLKTADCARHQDDDRALRRRETVDALARRFRADGMIYEQMKFCDRWGFGNALDAHIMSGEYGWPVLSIDRAYHSHGSDRLFTRFQAFVELLESGRIHQKKEAAGNG